MFQSGKILIYLLTCILYFQLEKNCGLIFKASNKRKGREVDIFLSSTHETRNPIYISSNKPTGKTDGVGTRKHKIGAISKACFWKRRKRKTAREITNKKHA